LLHIHYSKAGTHCQPFLLAVILPKHSITSAVHSAYGHTSIVIVVQVNGVLEKILSPGEQCKINLHFLNEVRRILQQMIVAMYTLPVL
jgi:hypothetical protein